jgi:hypothetical protein
MIAIVPGLSFVIQYEWLRFSYATHKHIMVQRAVLESLNAL